LSFKRPGKMLWRYDTPKDQFVLADGKHLYFYQPEQNQIVKSPLKNAFRTDIPLSFLLGLGNLKKDFNATLKGTEESQYILRLEPKGDAGGYSDIHMGVSKPTSDILWVSVRDGAGNVTTLRFAEMRKGVGIKDSLFQLQIPNGADIVLVNTCGFIDAAKAESVETILEIGRLKEAGKVKKLIVAGCLSQRYSDELAKELPEVDFFIGTGEVPRIAEILRRHEADQSRRQFVGLPSYLYDHATPRLRTTPSYSAYLKVSEGCDHKCAFCIIPQLRGPHRSRSIDSVIKEAELLAQGGVKEINLIAQDLTAYGRDRKDGTTLYGLLRDLDQVRDIAWIRLLYAYPNYLDDALLTLIGDSDKICSYLDIPFQHVSRAILQRMRRGKSGSAVRESVQKLRAAIPGLTLRTTLIVGFPGETDANFQELLDFVEETRFERLGVFKYSDEEGNGAAKL